MTVTSVEKDPVGLTMTVNAVFDAPEERVWALWSDPRQLERWWGPPSYPATFVDHDFAPGGGVRYFMTGPDGERYHGWWTIRALDPPRRLEFEDGFSDDAGQPNLAMPVSTVRVAIDGPTAPAEGTTRMTIVTTFPSTEAMEQLTAMGMEEGLAAALGQIDAILAES